MHEHQSRTIDERPNLNGYADSAQRSAKCKQEDCEHRASTVDHRFVRSFQRIHTGIHRLSPHCHGHRDDSWVARSADGASGTSPVAQCVASDGVVCKVASTPVAIGPASARGGDQVAAHLRTPRAGYWSGGVQFRRTWIRWRLLCPAANFTRKRWPSAVTS